MFPYLVTGLLTASGGAWNASIVSEYVQFNGQTHSIFSLGATIAESAASENYPVLLAGTLMMSAFLRNRKQPKLLDAKIHEFRVEVSSTASKTKRVLCSSHLKISKAFFRDLARNDGDFEQSYDGTVRLA